VRKGGLEPAGSPLKSARYVSSDPRSTLAGIENSSDARFQVKADKALLGVVRNIPCSTLETEVIRNHRFGASPVWQGESFLMILKLPPENNGLTWLPLDIRKAVNTGFMSFII
jgi:hypothetical protein